MLTNVPIQFYVAYRSMIITGCSKWTLYEFSNFAGESACWQPSANCTPLFVRNPQMMQGWAKEVSSIRKGCHARTLCSPSLCSITEKYIPVEKLANNATIGSAGQVFGN